MTVGLLLVYEDGYWDNYYVGGGRDIVLHKARTDQSIDVLAMKPLRKYGSGIGEKILSRFRPSKLFLSQFW